MLTFQELYTTYSGEVYRFALWLSADSFTAGDITSETFIRAWVHRSTIRTETLKAYLFTIARNIYLEQGRKLARQVTLEDVHINPAPGPDRVVEVQMELAKVRQVLQTLPEIDRTAFVLRIQHELPYAEIARVLEISLAAAKVKVHRVRKKILAAFAAVEVYS
jgi:RNA polymerase sigma factor (sigma-70 family)